MDEFHSVLPSSYPTSHPVPPPKPPWVLIGLLYFVLIGIASYFGYQYYRLKQQLASPNQPPPSTHTINSPSPLPSPTTTDLITSWKTYDDNLNKFSFKYPNSWQDFPLNTISDNIVELKSLETDLIANGLIQDAGPDRATQNPKIVFKIIKFADIDDIDTWVEGRKSRGEVHAKVANTFKIDNYQFTEVVGLGTVGGCTKDWFLKIPSGGYLSFTLDPYNDDCSVTSVNNSIDAIVRQVLKTFLFHL